MVMDVVVATKYTIYQALITWGALCMVRGT